MMNLQIPNHIFKAYDIRGIYPEEINEDVAYKLGRAYITFLREEKRKHKFRIVVASDMRISSPQLKQHLINGLTDQGADVIEIGLASSPTFYFAVANYNYDGGIQVSASHNPKEYNGFKIVKEKAIPVSKDTGIYHIRELVIKNDFPTADKGDITSREGVLYDQLNHDLLYADLEKIKPFTVVADPGNAMGAQYLEALFSKLPGRFIKMNFDLDGTFPNHQADPLKEENLIDIKNRILKEHADFGIATDGDGDRIFLIDETGETVPSHILRGFLAKIFLRENPGETICYDIRPGKITKDMIIENGGKPILTRVGHSLIKEKMREVQSYFAGESSGHYFLRFNDSYYEAPIVIILKILEELSESERSLSQLISPYNRYFHSGEINSTVDDKDGKIAKLTEIFKDAKNINYLDGVTIEYDDFWFNVRPSNTEPLLRLNLEATTKEKMKTMRDTVLKIIREK
jgi:phosphomannomutase